MRVLVTGHAGYVGSVATQELRQAGHDVTGADRSLRAGHAERVDFRDIDTAALSEFDAVVHLAAIDGDAAGEVDPAATEEINHRATSELADRARHAGVRRFVLASSYRVYGSTRGFVDESSPVRPDSAFGLSKARAERDVLAMNRGGDGFATTVLRFGSIFGTAPSMRLDTITNNLTAWATTTRRVRLYSTGAEWRPILHVQAASKVLERVLSSPRGDVAGEVFNVGRSSDNHRVRQIAQVVQDMVPHSMVEFAPGAGQNPCSVQMACNYIQRRVAGLRIGGDVFAAVRNMFLALRNAGVEHSEIATPRFDRAAALRQEIASTPRGIAEAGSTPATVDCGHAVGSPA